MARKKYLDENNDEEQGKSQEVKGKGPVLKSFQHNQQQHLGGGLLLGGGTKNHNKTHEYHHTNSKNCDDSYGSVGKQLSSLGLTIREMPGDGNCLFRALSDQITGTSRNHLEYRRTVVQYMKEFRADFEPFVEDDVPFDKYVQRLSQAGTFAGNDAIVAFARLHNVSVVIHQLNSPAWIIHPSKDTQEPPSGREVHIFYHNGDHYNSVRRVGDDSENPTNIKLHAQTNSKSGFNKAHDKKSPPHTTASSKGTNSSTATDSYDSSNYDSYSNGRDQDYWVKDFGDVDRLVEEVMQQTNYPDPNLVRDTLLDYNFDMVATIDFIISMSVIMNQQHCHQPKSEEKSLQDLQDTESVKTEVKSVSESELDYLNDGDTKSVVLSPSKKLVTNMDEQCDDMGDSEEGMPDESDDGSISPNEALPSQENEEDKPTTRKEPRLSTRQKKELKKRERKREADLRRKSVSNNVGANNDRENPVVVSSLGSLDI